MAEGLMRIDLFKHTTGAFGYMTRHGPTSANLHPDRCVCQKKERGINAGTPHQHYREPPFRCARCSECTGYEPELPYYWEGQVLGCILDACGLTV